MVHSSLCITLETACVAQIISDVVTYNLAQGGDHSKPYQNDQEVKRFQCWSGDQNVVRPEVVWV